MLTSSRHYSVHNVNAKILDVAQDLGITVNG